MIDNFLISFIKVCRQDYQSFDQQFILSLGTIVLFLIFLLRCIINWLCLLVKNGYKKEELKVNLGKVHPTNLINHDPFTTGKYNVEQSWEFMLNKLE